MTNPSRLLAPFLLFVAMTVPGVTPASAEQARDGDRVLAGPNGKSNSDSSERRFDGSRRKGHKQGFMFRLLEDLDLTEDQQQEAKQLLKEHRESWKAWKTEHQEELDQIKSQMKELHQKRRKLMEDAPKPGDGLEKLRPVLDPEQQEQLDAMIEKIKERHNRRHKRSKPSGRHGDEDQSSSEINRSSSRARGDQMDF